MTVARAIVRDQFIGSEASSILNLIGIMLAIGPAIGPTMGGLSLAAFGWHSVFWLMVGFGVISVVAVVFFLRETTVPDRKLIRPSNLVRAYAELLRNKRFLFAAMIMAGSVGALYAQATMLSFILINEVGLTPTGFGLSMLMQSGAYFSGSVALRFLVKILGDRHSAILGLCCSGIGGTLMILSVFLLEPSFITIMGPVAVATFGIALITPYIVTAAMAPFPHIAGSASAMMGFIQMSSGFIAGVMASLIGSPLLAFGTVIPFMEFMAIAGYIGFASFTRKTA
jgi:DHA1 family purine ribonucleoside efflux pump-like MFS transporter/DHA1 family bicyclomycin/chloramphenicol resistance-like MFS transporter